MPNPFKKQVFNKPYWIPDEKALVDQFVKEMLSFYRKNNIGITPLLFLRLDDIAQTYLLVQRLESTLMTPPPSQTTLGSLETENVSKPGWATKKEGEPVALETLGKMRDRLRKALKEVEDGCAKAFTSPHQGIADRMRPILKKAEGVLEDSLQQELAEEQIG